MTEGRKVINKMLNNQIKLVNSSFAIIKIPLSSMFSALQSGLDKPRHNSWAQQYF